MTAVEVETGVYHILYDFFEEHNFQLLSDKKQFRKTSETGFQNVIFSVSMLENECWLEVNLGIRKEAVEQIAQQFLDNFLEYQADANTLVISIGKYNDAKYFRYKIQNHEDLQLACAQIMEFLIDTGLVFLSSSMEMAQLDRLLNGKANKPCKFMYNQVHRCFKGLIVARLINNPQLLKIMETYRRFLEKAGKPSDLLNFDRLANYLLHYSVN